MVYKRKKFIPRSFTNCESSNTTDFSNHNSHSPSWWKSPVTLGHVFLFWKYISQLRRCTALYKLQLVNRENLEARKNVCWKIKPIERFSKFIQYNMVYKWLSFELHVLTVLGLAFFGAIKAKWMDSTQRLSIINNR